MATILTKKSDTSSSVPLAADLTNAAGGAELAVNTADKRLYSKTSGGTIVELGTNPSSMTLPNGTANGVPYLNGSKVLTSGSALTFDGAVLQNYRNTTDGSAAALMLWNAGTSNSYATLSQNAGSVGYQQFSDAAGNAIGSAGVMFRTTSNHPLMWGINNAEAMRLTSTGLGIGTSSPVNKLHVVGTSYINVGAYATGYALTLGASSETSRTYQIGMVTGGNLAIYDSGAAATRLVLDSSGNLGLGVTPSAWGSGRRSFALGPSKAALSTQTGFGDVSLTTNAYNNGTNWIYEFSIGATRYDLYNGVHTWYTAPSGTAGNAILFTQAMTLDASGNLLVGTTSLLSTSRGVFHAAVNGNAAEFKVATNGYGLVFFSAASAFVGSIAINSASVSYNTSSDYRLKENIAPMTGALAKVAQLKPVTYKWKADGSDGEGFIAHELAEVCPAAVTGEKDAVDKDGKPQYQGIDVSFLVGTLTAAIQEQQALITALTARVAALESK